MCPANRYAGRDPEFDAKHGVLTNKLGITDPADLEKAMAEALARAYQTSFHTYSDTHRFSVKNVCDLHRTFLGGIFNWAGEFRNVDISSDDIFWCRAVYVPAKMREYDKLLAALTPFPIKLPPQELLQRLALLHGNMILIHPFRDGNGRVTRLLGDLLLAQAHHQPISHLVAPDSKDRPDYLAAIRAYYVHADLVPLQRFFEGLL